VVLSVAGDVYQSRSGVCGEAPAAVPAVPAPPTGNAPAAGWAPATPSASADAIPTIDPMNFPAFTTCALRADAPSHD
jgi:hypothetical protein